jgi:hypothetical protein
MKVIMGTGLHIKEEDFWAVHIERLRFGRGKHWSGELWVVYTGCLYLEYL